MSSMYNCDSVAVLNYYRRNNPHKPTKKTAHFYVFCGLQKLNTLNLRLFHSPSNPRNHFSTVLIETNWYTTSCKYGGCIKLESLSLPNSVTYIGNRAFVACEKLTSFTIPNSITSISANCFERCYGLTSIEIPNSVTSIGESAFLECTGLISIDLPNSVINIRGGAFSKCSKLTTITIPNSVETIGGYAFSECVNLQSVNIPNKVSTIDNYTFQNCKSLASIDIPNTVNAIKSGAFQGCTSLKTITFPNSINTISSSVCQGCEKLAKVTIPSSIQSIGNSAFSSCSELKDFYCFASIVPSTNLDVFNDSYIEYATLHIPSSSANAYKENAPWNCFGNIVTLENEEIIPSKCATPTINYREGKLIFNCETEGAEFITEITDNDIKKYYESEISLNATYNISVYAVKTGYINSDIVYATLCWIDLEPQTEGISNEVASIRAEAALIQNDNGIITIKGIKNGTCVGVYSLSGVQVSSTISQNGGAILNTNVQPGSTVIVTIGKKSVKVLMK